MNGRILGDDALDKLQRDTFCYFLEETNPRNGLVPDSTREGAPSSIAAVGFALAAYAAGAERCPFLVTGLGGAGSADGWLSATA